MAIGQVRWRRGKVGGKSCWFGASVQADTHTLVHTPFEYRHGWEEGFILASKGIGAAQLELSRDDDKGGGFVAPSSYLQFTRTVVGAGVNKRRLIN